VTERSVRGVGSPCLSLFKQINKAYHNGGLEHRSNASDKKPRRLDTRMMDNNFMTIELIRTR
jgi:hypothetical protein